MAVFVLAAAGAGAIGGIAIPGYLYARCPQEYRQAVAPKFTPGEPTFLLFVEPGCPYCAQLRQKVLSAYEGSLHWAEVSGCTAVGRGLLRLHRITSFPTLIVEQDGQTLVDAEGVDEIRLALREFKVQAPARGSEIRK